MARTQIKLISFDLDDTLWDGKKLIQNAHQAMLDWIIRQQPELTTAQVNTLYFSLRETVLRAHPHMNHHPSFIRKTVLHSIFIQLNFSTEQAKMYANDAFDVFYRHRNRVEFFPNVSSTLNALKKHYKLAALTNGNANPIDTGLQLHLDFFISAEQTGIAKPDPGIFSALLEKSKLSAEECVHIGDHPQLDIMAAQQCGMRSIWFNPERRAWTENVKPNHEFNSFDGLEDLIKSFEEAS